MVIKIVLYEEFGWVLRDTGSELRLPRGLTQEGGVRSRYLNSSVST